ncbi:MAG TPA: IgGFc-binding protein [Minicystis sp.]|nr:IgGFc-binding protein [Minicystis sp.]
MRHASLAGLALVAFGSFAWAACSAAGNQAASSGLGSGGSGGAAAGTGGLGQAGGPCHGDSCAAGGGSVIPDPTTCAEAAQGHTYLGCDFWPTVVDNSVRPVFDFAAVVANPGATEASVTVTRGGQAVASATVPPNGLAKLYLPWVPELKSLSWMNNKPDNGCPTWVKTQTVAAPGGAYHLVSTRPVAVYQFNAIEYAGKGGGPGKDWSDCQTKTCFGMLDCFSYTNDASLLLPSTAMTGTYRVAGLDPWTEMDSSDPNHPTSFTWPAYFAVTGTADGTTVTVRLSSTGAIAGGGGVPSTSNGGTATFGLGAGDVVMVVGTAASDFSGTLVEATKPVQVITGTACTRVPFGTEACDHIEESVLPAETLGKHYFVTVPTGPGGAVQGHRVRLYGNVDGTHLTYHGQAPNGPSTLHAGQVVDLGMVTGDFEVEGDHEFTVASFQRSAGPVSGNREGDPSQSFSVTVEQYRLKYVFLAPDDYDESWVDVVAPVDATLTLDGHPVSTTITPISSGYGVARVALDASGGGVHVLEASKPVGIQVLGYGAYTSYQYPGGLNLGKIAPPPVK